MFKYSVLENLLFPPKFLSKKKLWDELQGKAILITGASSGIGENLAYFLADFDIHMILVARREDRLKRIMDDVEKKAAKASIFSADLRNREEIDKLSAFLHQLPDGLDFIVSNAGKSIKRSIHDSLDRFHDFTRTMDINYFAPVRLLLSVIPLLKESRGQIINVSTINTMLIPFPHWAAYQASKTAFDTWLRSVSPELQSIGITTTSIYLPLVRTPMIEPTAAYKNMPAMNPVHVVKIICRSMYTKRKKFKPWWLIFGQLASVLFREPYEALLPRILRKRGR